MHACSRGPDLPTPHLQTWRVRHLPVRRTKGGTPKVHSGFYKAWRRNGFDETVGAL